MYKRIGTWPLWARLLVDLAWGGLILLVFALFIQPPTALLVGMIVLFIALAPALEWLRGRR